MRIIIIGLVALLVLGGGAAGAYFYFSKGAEASIGADEGLDHEAESGDHSKDKKHAKKGKHGEEVLSFFVELDPLMLPIVDNNGVHQVVSLVVALEVADEEIAGRVEQMKPKLTDAIIQDTYGILNRHAAMNGGLIEIQEIKARLNKVANDVMGDDEVHDVLLQVVQQRPI